MIRFSIEIYNEFNLVSTKNDGYILKTCIFAFINNKINMKTIIFEYLLLNLLQWHFEINGNKDYSSFTKLKIQKLLFLTSAVKNNNNDYDLLDIFDNFYAMQYGPVESDIYNLMKENKSTLLSFNENFVNILNGNDYGSDIKEIITNFKIDKQYKQQVDSAIAKLKIYNNDIISYNVSMLVEITHRWNSWKIAMEVANLLNKRSAKMDVRNIRMDEQYFSI